MLILAENDWQGRKSTFFSGKNNEFSFFLYILSLFLATIDAINFLISLELRHLDIYFQKFVGSNFGYFWASSYCTTIVPTKYTEYSE